MKTLFIFFSFVYSLYALPYYFSSQALSDIFGLYTIGDVILYSTPNNISADSLIYPIPDQNLCTALCNSTGESFIKVVQDTCFCTNDNIENALPFRYGGQQAMSKAACNAMASEPAFFIGTQTKTERKLFGWNSHIVGSFLCANGKGIRFPIFQSSLTNPTYIEVNVDEMFPVIVAITDFSQNPNENEGDTDTDNSDSNSTVDNNDDDNNATNDNNSSTGNSGGGGYQYPCQGVCAGDDADGDNDNDTDNPNDDNQNDDDSDNPNDNDPNNPDDPNNDNQNDNDDSNDNGDTNPPVSPPAGGGGGGGNFENKPVSPPAGDGDRDGDGEYMGILEQIRDTLKGISDLLNGNVDVGENTGLFSDLISNSSQFISSIQSSVESAKSIISGSDNINIQSAYGTCDWGFTVLGNHFQLYSPRFHNFLYTIRPYIALLLSICFWLAMIKFSIYSMRD
ncbi:hypothetical protein AGMMS50229_06910 [Campylobacterota bacterium]|nr:hypothetical protein AGMMS50229_06910 [Campylobacterota bacterium]